MAKYQAYVKFANPHMGFHGTTSFEVLGDNLLNAIHNAEVVINERWGGQAKLDNIRLHDYELPTSYPEEQAINLPDPHSNRWVCPDCAKHDQGEPMEVHDCKTVFRDKNNQIIGQCCCWSAEHGLRKED